MWSKQTSRLEKDQAWGGGLWHVRVRQERKAASALQTSAVLESAGLAGSQFGGLTASPLTCKH